jgi:hypothetical protein
MQRGCLDEGTFAVLGDLQGGECKCVHMVPGTKRNVCGGIFFTASLV